MNKDSNKSTSVSTPKTFGFPNETYLSLVFPYVLTKTKKIADVKSLFDKIIENNLPKEDEEFKFDIECNEDLVIEYDNIEEEIRKRVYCDQKFISENSRHFDHWERMFDHRSEDQGNAYCGNFTFNFTHKHFITFMHK